MKISIITVVFNGEKTISETIKSVNNQVYSNIEHIVIDGKSTDGTLETLKNFDNLIVLSESDSGIYDAMNKGAYLSTGEIICFLNADDSYCDQYVISDVVKVFEKTNADFVYGDIKMIDFQSKLVVREWVTGHECITKLRNSQIPHPAFFIKNDLLKSLTPPFDSNYHIAADLKQQLLIINKLRKVGYYIPRFLVNMSMGGASTNGFFSYFKGWQESILVYNDLFGRGGLYFTLRKVSRKISQFFF